MSTLTDILTQRQASEDYLRTKRRGWDMYEQLFHNQLADRESDKMKSKVFDPKLSTLTLERAYRVMAQMPTGKAKAISKNDLGTAELMDLIIDKYVNPNANAQFDLLTKFRMMDIYSNIYGNYFSLVDWDVKPNGYMGPDIWLLNIRDVFPQIGAVSIEDSDEIIVRTWRPLSFFERLKSTKGEGFTNVSSIIDKLKNIGDKKQTRDANQTSEREKEQFPQTSVPNTNGYFEVLSRYEKDRWVDVCVDANQIFRDTNNPHDDEELPVVCKYSIPLIDDIMGMGDFERGAPMQNVINTAWNLYGDAVKMSIFPPVILNKDNMAAPSSFNYVPAAKWLARGNVGNVAQTLQLNPKGVETFNNIYGLANGSLQNLYGTTDTTITNQSGGGMDFGKTPQAIQMQAQRQNTRDTADQFFMEQYLVKVYKKFVNLIGKKQSSAITMRMFAPEVQEMAINYPEIAQMYNEKTGELTIDKKHTGSTLYDWEIVSGSSFLVDQKTQQQNMVNIMNMLVFVTRKGPILSPVIDALQQEGMEIHLGQLFKQIISQSGIQDWQKILIEKTPQEMAQGIMQNHAQQLEAAMQQMMGNPVGQVPVKPGQPQAPPVGPNGSQTTPQGPPLPQGMPPGAATQELPSNAPPPNTGGGYIL